MPFFKLYADENFPFPCVTLLRSFGYDVETVYEAGKANQCISDSEVLEHATRTKRAVITHNRKDFKQLHHKTQSHCGIIACTADNDFNALAQRIHDQLMSKSALDGRFLLITRK